MLVNIPNSLTLARIVLVPLVVWLIITHEMTAASLSASPVICRSGLSSPS